MIEFGAILFLAVISIVLFSFYSFLVFTETNLQTVSWFIPKQQIKESNIFEILLLPIVYPILLCLFILPVKYFLFLMWIQTHPQYKSISQKLNYQPFVK